MKELPIAPPLLNVALALFPLMAIYEALKLGLFM
jgi:hypothetical protein